MGIIVCLFQMRTLFLLSIDMPINVAVRVRVIHEAMSVNIFKGSSSPPTGIGAILLIATLFTSPLVLYVQRG
jgi:hypothetical protein